MNPKMEKVSILIVKATKDYSTSKKLFEDDCDYYWDIICFHCQQCIEKYLKAFLMYHEIVFPKTHDLEYLVELCLPIDDYFNNFDLSEFADFGVEIRYDDIPNIADTTKKALETAKIVIDYVKSCIKIEESNT